MPGPMNHNPITPLGGFKFLDQLLWKLQLFRQKQKWLFRRAGGFLGGERDTPLNTIQIKTGAKTGIYLVLTLIRSVTNA